MFGTNRILAGSWIAFADKEEKPGAGNSTNVVSSSTASDVDCETAVDLGDLFVSTAALLSSFLSPCSAPPDSISCSVEICVLPSTELPGEFPVFVLAPSSELQR